MDRIKSAGSKFSKIITQYKYLILILVISLIIILLSHFLSEKYSVEKCLDRVKLYSKFLRLDSKLKNMNYQKYQLSNFYIASSYKSCCSNNEKFDYLSLDILEQIIKSGARALWFDIYNETFDSNTKPVVSNGYEVGQWKLNLNYLYFEDCCKLISEIAFSSGNVDNYSDPLFIALNLNVNKNLKTLSHITELLYKYFSKRLLDSNYSSNKKNMGGVNIKKLMNKIIIMSNSGYEDSPLEELVNMTWDTNNFRKIDDRAIDANIKDSEYIKLDQTELTEFNTGNLTMIVKENYYYSYNYDPKYGFKTGCQFVFMNYQNVDSYMDDYISKFINSSFELKPKEMLQGITNEQSIGLSKRTTNKYKKETEGPQCPEKPNDDQELIDTDSLSPDKSIEFKNKTDKLGVCTINSQCPISYDKNNRKQWKEVKSSIPMVISQTDKDSGFKYGCVNSKAGNSPDGSQLLNLYPKICCSNTINNNIQNQHSLSPNCHNPETYVGTIGLKVDSRYISKTPFSVGNEDGKYTWVYPKLCKINSLEEVKDGKNCLISTKKCPKDWNNNGDKILLENNWNLCCRNLD